MSEEEMFDLAKQDLIKNLKDYLFDLENVTYKDLDSRDVRQTLLQDYLNRIKTETTFRSLLRNITIKNIKQKSN